MAAEHHKGVIYSAVLHLVMLAFAIFGLPSFLKPKLPPQPMVIAVEILPVSPITNVKPSDEPLATEEKPEPPQQKPTPPTPQSQPTPPPPPPPEAVPEPKKEEKPPEKKQEKKKEEKKPEPKKEEKPKKKQEDKFEDVLKNLKKNSPKPEDAQPKEAKKEDESGTKVKAKDAKYDPGLPMSMSELDAIRSQIAKCWSVPAGAKNAADLQVVLRVQLQQDGTVTQVGLADESKSRYNSDSFFQAAADSAMRAVRKCSPLQNLPPEKYQTWRDIIMTFDPKEMLF